MVVGVVGVGMVWRVWCGVVCWGVMGVVGVWWGCGGSVSLHLNPHSLDISSHFHTLSTPPLPSIPHFPSSISHFFLPLVEIGYIFFV